MKNGTIWQHIYSIENARKFKNTAFLKIFLFFLMSFKGLKNFSERRCEVKKDFRQTCSTCRGSPLSPHRCSYFAVPSPGPLSAACHPSLARTALISFRLIISELCTHRNRVKNRFQCKILRSFVWRKPFCRRLSGSRDIST